jgi:hypothetical protein
MRSQELNQIEHARDMLKKAIYSRHIQPTTVQENELAIIEECAQISHHKIRRLISSMGGDTRS